MSKTTLTKADKGRIEEEEKYKTEVRRGLSKTPKQKSKGRGKGYLTLIIILIVLGAIGSIIPACAITTTCGASFYVVGGCINLQGCDAEYNNR